jgi:tetratricopeptide (TPR) repeat protein
MRNPEVSLNEVRLSLAERYQKAGRFDLAYKEYESLVRMNPYIAANYRDAATSLLQLEDLPRALTYLQKSLVFEETFFATFRMAEIYLIMGDYDSAITHFNEAFYLAPEESKVNVLGKSYVALVYANNTERAKTIAAELERLRATQYLRIPPKRYAFNDYIPFQTKKQVQEAKEMMGQQRNDEALQLLESSLTIYDSHIANRLIGEIHFENKNHELAQQYFDKVYDQFRFDSQFLIKLALLQQRNAL